MLADAERRSRYDRFGHAAFEQGGFGGFDFGGGFEDIIGDLFGDFFGTGRGRGGRTRARRGQDLQYQLEVTFEEAARGCEKTISIPRLTPCATCNGQRRQAGHQAEDVPAVPRLGPDPLPAGLLLDRQDLRQLQRPRHRRLRPVRRLRRRRRAAEEVHAERQDSSRGRQRLAPEAARRGRERGQRRPARRPLRPDPGRASIRSSIARARTWCARSRSASTQAALGTEIEVPTLDGPRRLKVAAGTQSGHLFRLRGLGVPDLSGYGRGDQVVRVVVETPRKLSARQRELLEEFARISGEEVHPMSKSFLEKVKSLLD